MAEEPRVAAKLDALEAARVAVEAEYLECMHRFEVRADSLRALLDRFALASAEDASDDPPVTEDKVGAAQAPLMASTARPARPTERAGWELPSAGLRGWLANWLIGDLLPTLDQRQGTVEHALADLQSDIVALRKEVGGALERVQEHAAAQLEAGLEALRTTLDQQRAAAAEVRSDDLHRWQGMGEALEHVVEALTLVTRLSEKLRAVVDAKDAEALQRAVGGPLLQIEVIFDELTRRQEALLAELVGRRQELDELIDSVSRGD